MNVHPLLAAHRDWVISVRRALHRIPETAFTETETQAFLLKTLSSLCPDKLEPLAKTGVKAVFYADPARPDAPGQVIALRSDIDALAVTEETGAEYASMHEGRMHACGHDGHMAMLLLCAKLVSEHRACLKESGQTVVFLFQPGEEHTGGARFMVADGCLKNPDVQKIYGMHLWPEVPFGKIGFLKGPMMAQTCEFDIFIEGKSAHGASPHRGIDAIVAAAEIISALQTVVTRSVDPFEKALITVGKITGGRARNVIADRVELNGTARSFSKEVYETVKARIGAILQGAEVTHGVKCTFVENVSYPVLVNDGALYEKARTLFAPDELSEVREVMAAEDFSFYQNEVPGLYFWVGIGDEAHREPLHSAHFSFDEEALLCGAEVYRRILGIGEGNE